ncbi:MAG TPA: hypothetical protein VGH65_08650 [Verrucomicrobiaceae bacterium]|jgi:hypothetical protein
MKLPSLLLTMACLTLGGLIARAQSPAISDGLTKVPVTFSGGHDTDRRDHGRPVILVGSALGVTSEVFRDAFSRVHPAGPGSGGPTREEAQANKKVLMDALGKYGITNDRLDEVSNFYRYPPGSKNLWKHTPAVANALVKDGVVTGYEIVDGGAGYTNPPTLEVPGVKGATAKVELAFGKDFKTNGSVSKITAADDKTK